MGQFDFPSEAALTRVKADLPDPLVAGLVSIGRGVFAIVTADGYSTALAGFDLLDAMKRLGAKKDEANLIYLGEAIVDDIRRLYRLNDEARHRLQSVLESAEFAEALADATLHATRTNVKNRLKRLAHVIANSVHEGELANENLDDMMRLAVVLTEKDVEVLKIVYEMQCDLLSPDSLRDQRAVRTNHLMRRWQEWWAKHIGEYSGVKGLEFMNSSARLLGEGLVGPMQKSFASSPTQNDLELLLSGVRFYEHLREISADDGQSSQM